MPAVDAGRRPSNVLSVPGVPSLLEELCHGRLPLGLAHPFPVQDPADAGRGDEAVREICALLPDPMPAEGEPVDGLADVLRAAGYLHLCCGESAGGRGLSAYNAFRVITAVSERSVAAGLLLAIHNGIGAPAYLPVLPPGPLRDFVHHRLAAGAISGMADTEPGGAANRARETTATPVDGGAAYLLNGRKLYIGNGPVAELFAVTATVHGDGGARTRVFFVDAATPGVEVTHRLEFLGFRGFPNGALSFRDVRVPADRLVPEGDGVWLPAERAAVLSRGRVYVVGAPSLAVARNCVRWAREYVRRRTVDGIPLGEYDEVQRTVSAMLADTFALETVAQWTMLGDTAATPVNLMPEQVAAKDITSLLCWRVAEQTLTLLAGEGFETARSKASRGVTPAPVEQLFRDARGTRIAGGTEVLLQTRLAANVVLSYFSPEPGGATDDAGAAPPAGLGPRNREHWRALAAEVAAFARTCAATARAHPDRATPAPNGRVLVLIGRLAEELVTTTLVLARTATEPGAGDLADLYCTAAGQRVADCRRQLADASRGPDTHRAVSAAWFAGDGASLPGGAG
jgi:alkylation response protein AidB-like acyl-CoA dehydrogenase